MPSSDSSREVLLGRLAEEFVERHRRGERPAIAEYADRYPDLAAEIRDLFPALVHDRAPQTAAGDLTGDFAPRSGVQRWLRPRASGRLPHPARGRVAAAWASSTRPSRSRWAGTSPSRCCRRQVLFKPTYLERFRREAQAAASCTIPTSCRSSASASATASHYYAMQFIQGEGLDKVLGDLRRLQPARRPTGRLDAVRGQAWRTAC